MGKKMASRSGATLISFQHQTIRDAFLASAEGEGVLVRIDSNEEEKSVSYRELKTRAARIAGQLTMAGVRPADPVILIMEDPLAFACGFWACILGGFVAVPLPPMENQAQRERTVGAIAILDTPFVLSDLPLVDDGAVDTMIGGRGVLAGPHFDQIFGLPEGQEPTPDVFAHDITIIQFSSGSTGRPKGIQLRHANVLANIVALADRINLTPQDVIVNWMPLSHDFGLFHFHILPVLTGIKHVLMSSHTFARKPISWIRAMARHQATVSGAPNFALRLVAMIMKSGRAAKFDLSSVRHITNGAEPLDAHTISTFLHAMEPARLSPLAIRPAYGLAEATLVVTMAKPGVIIRLLHVDRTHLAIGDTAIHLHADHAKAMPLLTLGLPIRSSEIRTVDDAGEILGENVIGRIQVRSPSVMLGYINNVEATKAALLADGWLDTGDIGFIDHGELVTNCRSKDLIIVNGVNYYPADIEIASESTPGLSWSNTLSITQARMPGGNAEVVVAFVRYRGNDVNFAKIARKIEETVLTKTGLAIDYCLAMHNIPKTTSGKVQRFDLANRFSNGEFDQQITRAQAILAGFGEPLAEAMRLGNLSLAARLIANEAESLTNNQIKAHDALMEQGVSSLQAVTLCNRLAVMTGRTLTIADIFDYPSAHALAEFMMARGSAAKTGEEINLAEMSQEEIAVIGYGCRFPCGANDPEAFWRLLDGNDDDLTLPIPADRWAGTLGRDDSIPGRASLLDDIDGFDHIFFGISSAEASALDPRQRLLLDVLWQSMEHAGLDPEQLRGRRVGLFIGLSETGLATGDTRLIPDEAAAWTYGVTGSATSIAVGRMAHIFDFRGPAVAIDTACSSSLVAITMAMRAIRSGECELTIAGGANVLISPDLHAGLARMGALAADGRCKTFSGEADGYGRGEGAGLVILKARDQAESDGDDIHAILLGCAQNHDGASQNVTAPNGQSQRQLLRRALLDANIGSADVDWIETHGTGTPLGDPIEVSALAEVFPRQGAEILPLGAVKSRIGHLEAAGGVAGVIKALLALTHECIPRNGHRETVNPNINWAGIPTQPVDQPLDWPKRLGHRRIVGISAFGMSGTNAHLLIAEDGVSAHLPETKSLNRPVLAISARNVTALEHLRDIWVERLSGSEPAEWSALLAGSCTRRGGHQHRLALPLNPSAKGESLQRLLAVRGVEAWLKPSVLFTFTGQGAQAPGMLSAVYRDQPAFKTAVDEASFFAGPIAGRLLVDWLYGVDAADRSRLDQTDLAQPALVAVAWGLVQLLAEWGVRPDGVLGHSVGEIPAALVAGAIDLETAMRLAVLRGRVMQTLAPEGCMVAVSADEEAVLPLLSSMKNLTLASFNGPKSLTVSGPPKDIDKFCQRAQAAGFNTKVLDITRAFHGPAMIPAATRLAEDFGTMSTRPLGLPLFSTMTGAMLDDTALADISYWHDQMLSPVRFTEAVAAAAQSGFNLMIEIGPHAILSKLGPASAPQATWVATHDVTGGNDFDPLAEAVSMIWRSGGKIDWRNYYGSRGVAGDRLPRHPLNLQLVPRNPWAAQEMPKSPPTRANVPSAPTTSSGRADIVQTIIQPLLTRIAGINENLIVGTQSFLAHGLDSLMIIQLQRAVKTETGLDIPVRDFYDGAETPHLLAELLAQNLLEQSTPSLDDPALNPQGVVPASDDIPALMRAQLQTVQDIINRQLETLAMSGVVAPGTRRKPEKTDLLPAHGSGKSTSGEIKGLFRQPNKQGKGLRAMQQAHIAQLALAWNTKSAGSKHQAAADRSYVANSRSVFGFRQEYKELVYPLVVERADGAKVWDVDGNEYVDITMGFGVNLFGHNPPFVKEAVSAELTRGAAIGPVSRLAGEVAERIHHLTGMERCAFFSTGTEAIMCAVRLARAVTGRTRLVIFKGAYHGSFDGVLATGWIDGQGRPETIPITDGTPDGMVDSLIVLDYGDMAGLDVIARYANEIALVLVEPVQSRNPGNLPLEFLVALRQLTIDRDVPLLFDEIISGFRFAPGGMQELLGIQADIVTYGKVLGHGLPFGVVTGKARFMDAVDGGQWAYGDASAPGVRTAFVAGTFNGHPLALAAARAVLDKIILDNGVLQVDLAAKTENMCQRLDRLFAQEGIPVLMERYGSLFRFGFGEDTEILNTHLLLNGVFVWEQRNCFLSTAHTDQDIETIINAAARGIEAMKEAGWFLDTVQGEAPLPSTKVIPATASQTAMWHRAHDPSIPGLWTDMIAIDINGKVDEGRLAAAVDAVVNRHPGLCTVLVSETTQITSPLARAGLERLDLTASQNQESTLTTWMESAVRKPFEPYRAAIRLVLAKRNEDLSTLIILGNHLSFDGWSFALIIRDILAAYDKQPLPEPDGLEAYLAWEATTVPTSGQLSPAAMVLPGVLQGFAANRQAGSRITRTDLTSLQAAIVARARQSESTPFVLLLAAYAMMCSRLTNQQVVTIGLPCSGQVAAGTHTLVGNFSFVRPFTITLNPHESLDDFLRRLQTQLVAEARFLPLHSLPQRHVLFNLDGPLQLLADGLDIGVRPVPIVGARADLFVNLLIVNGKLLLDVDWPTTRFAATSVASWVENFRSLAERIALGGGSVGEVAAAAKADQVYGDVVDWLGLPALADFGPTSDVQQAVPATRRLLATETLNDTEKRLAAIWQSLLGCSVISPEDDFFECGGGSLSGVRLVAAIGNSFGVAITLADVFASPRLSTMATLVDGREAGLVSFFYPGDRSKAPVAPQQRRLWLLEEMAETGAAYTITVTLDFPWHLEAQAITQALQTLARRHDSLRTAIVVTEELPIQNIAKTIEPLLAYTDLRDQNDWQTRRAERLRELAATPIPLDRAPLWRVDVLQTPVGDCLVLSIHHIISDVWSIEVLLRDLLDNYRAARLGIAPLQPELALQYGDYCRWLAESADSEQSAALTYWTNYLADAPALTTIQGDRPRPPVKSFTGARVRTALSGKVLVTLRDRVKQCKSSLFQAVMAAVAIVVKQRTNRDDLLLGTISASRDRSGLEELVGMFANTLPIRFNVSDSNTLGDVVRSAREQLLAATTNDLASLDDIVQALSIPRHPSHNPLFEICVTHDDRRGIMRIATEHGVIVEEVMTQTTQFDLSLYVMESEGSLLLEGSYATEIFNPQTVEIILKDIVTILAAIAADPDQAIFPTSLREEPSPHQQRLWFVDRFENGQLYDAAPVYYNMALVCRLEHPLAPLELERRLHDLYDVLPVLNRPFHMDGELPGLSAGEPAVETTAEIAGGGFPNPGFGGALAAFIERPFDLSCDGLLRAGLLRTDGGETALVLAAHHIALDFWSLAETARLLMSDTTPSLQARTFFDEALKERRPADTWSADLAYWHQQLGGDLPSLMLPLDHSRPAIHTFTLGVANESLGAEDVAALQLLANRLSLNLDDIVLAAFVALLQRLSLQETIVIGTTVTNALDTERSIIGPLTNLVTVKVDIGQNVLIEPFILLVSRLVHEAISHGAIPFDTVVLDLKPKNDMSRTALFDVLYVRDEVVTTNKLLLPPSIGWGKYDLTLASSVTEDGKLALGLAFNRDIIDQATATHWLEILGVLLRGLPAVSDGKLSDWPLLAATAELPLVVPAPLSQDWTAFTNRSLPAAFAARVAATPETIAIVDGHIHLTYLMVEQRANRIANRLLAMGIGREDRVAIILARGADWPVAMLGVVKTGAAFVPFDPQTAVERSQRIMATADIKAIIVDDSIDEKVHSGDLLLLNLATDDLQTAAKEDPGLVIHGSQLAYVIFTSGSTGSPKGVMVEHRNLLSLILGQGELFALGEDEVWSWFHSPAFDFSIWEIWGSLLTGGRLVVVPSSAQRDMSELRALLHREHVTLLSLTPSAFYSLAAHEEGQPIADLDVRSVWFGGEALTPSNLGPWAKRYPECRLLNLFGITETTVHVTFRPLSSADLLSTDSIIGHALPSYSVTIRDPMLRLLPDGIAGEIVVGGSGVARGYLGQPQLTAERFMDDPLAPGQRIYRSGDLARKMLTGELIYLGRMDEQIKLRGFRIEPGEIEHNLMKLPGVRGAVVGTVAASDGKVDQVVAWLVADYPPDPDDVATRLNRTLPAYMIPTYFYLIKEIPLTANGKADRRLLTEMCDTVLGQSGEGPRPKPGLESDISAIWCTLLDVDTIGRDDNFFELGGHSLKANQAVLRIRRHLGFDLSLKDFFSAQSVSALAALLRTHNSIVEKGLPLAPELAAYPLSSPQHRLFAMQQADPFSVSYNMVGGFILTGVLDPVRLAQAFTNVVNRHEILRTRFDFVDGAPAQLIGQPIAGFDLPVIRAFEHENEDETINRLLATEFAHRFDLAQGSLLRAQLAELASASTGEMRSLLVINTHHIVADGWSVAVLMENLADFYASEGAPLAPMSRQYKDFSYWQTCAYAEHNEHSALSFWRGRLVDDSIETTIPTDFPRPPVRGGQGAMVRYSFTETVTADLRRAAVTAGTTLFVVFSALVHALLHIRSGATSTMIGTADAGRDMLEVEDQVGFYLNVIPLRLSADPEAPLSHWVAASSVEAGAVFAHKAYPFDLVLDKLKLGITPGHSPVFDILLLLQNNATPSGLFADLRIEALPDRTVSSKYDLNLMVEDRPAIELILEYDSNLFRRETAESLLDDLVRLVEALIADEDRSPISVLQSAMAPQCPADVGILDADDPLLGMG